MNILITTFSFPSLEEGYYDGKFVLAEARGYAENGAQVKVLTPYYPGAKTTEYIDGSIEVIRFRYFWPRNLHRLKKPGVAIYSNKSLLGLIQIPFIIISFAYNIFRLSGWADIIHSQWTVTALLALPAKFLRKTPVVMTPRGSDLRLLPPKVNRFIHKHVSGCIDCWGPQPSMLGFKKQYPAHYVALPLIVDYHPDGPIPNDLHPEYPGRFRVLFVGRLVQLKLDQGSLFFDLIECIPFISSSRDFHVYLIGDGEIDMINRLSQKIVSLGLEERISMLGGRSKISDYLNHADLGLGGQALNAVSQEYIVSGVPQIITREANGEAIWRDGHNAFLVDRGDVRLLANTISRIMDDRQLRALIANNSSTEMGDYVTNTLTGGDLYLSAFCDIIESEMDRP